MSSRSPSQLFVFLLSFRIFRFRLASWNSHKIWRKEIQSLLINIFLCISTYYIEIILLDLLVWSINPLDMWANKNLILAKRWNDFNVHIWNDRYETNCNEYALLCRNNGLCFLFSWIHCIHISIYLLLRCEERMRSSETMDDWTD